MLLALCLALTACTSTAAGCAPHLPGNRLPAATHVPGASHTHMHSAGLPIVLHLLLTNVLVSPAGCCLGSCHWHRQLYVPLVTRPLMPPSLELPSLGPAGCHQLRPPHSGDAHLRACKLCCVCLEAMF